MPIRFATFNVENLFSRPKAMNLSNRDLGTEKLDAISALQKELAKVSYDAPTIVALANTARGYFKINKTRGRNPLSWSRDNNTYSVKVRGRDDWDGFIELTRATFNFESVRNTGKFLRSVKADILALCEVESSEALRQFRKDQLSSLGLRHDLLVAGNDPRGIDIAVCSAVPIGFIRTNGQYRTNASDRRPLFSRDCLEVEFNLPGGRILWVLQNHLLSKLKASNDGRRKKQAEGLAKILSERFDLTRDLVIVSGDLNDEPHNEPLRPLLDVPHLTDVLAVTGVPASDRWTYYYGREDARNQIDYILISDALKPFVLDAGVDRRGIAGIDDLTSGTTSPISGITNWRNAASDHAAVWVDLDFN
ncbi:MAG: endonuclease/exonuclease/phosphatase family protein [Pseudomonadota bacterium]